MSISQKNHTTSIIALPERIEGAFPLKLHQNPIYSMSPSRQLAVAEFREALNTGTIRVESIDIADGLVLTKYDRFGLPFRTILCQQTGLIYTSPRLATEHLPLYYDRFYHRLHFGQPVANLGGLYHGAEPQGAKIWRHIRPHLEPSDSQLAILEIGAGVGNVLDELRSAAAIDGRRLDMLGTEFSNDCVMVAAKRGISMIQGGFDEAIATRRQFDAIILSHVFEHIGETDLALEKIRQLLKPQGILYVEVPGVFTIHRRYCYNFDWVEYVTHAHMHHYCLASLESVMQRGLFRLITGNEEVEAIFRLDESIQAKFKPDTCRDLVSFLRGYLALLALDRTWLNNSYGSADVRQQVVNAQARASQLATQLQHLESNTQSPWWLIKQMARFGITIFNRLINRSS